MRPLRTGDDLSTSNSNNKGLGRISEVIDPTIIRLFQALEPSAAVANIGYTKRKIAEKINTEPLEIFPRFKTDLKVVLTMDGYLIKEDDLKGELEQDYGFQTENKTEVIGALLHKYMTQEGISFEAGSRLIDS